MMLRTVPRWKCGLSLGKRLLFAGILAACGGCVTPAPVYQLSIANQMALMKVPSTARYQVVRGAEPADIQTHVRSLSIAAPADGSWTSYLKEALRIELVSAGLYSADAPAVLTASLSDVHVLDGHADLAGRFVVSDGRAVIYDKVLRAQTKWDVQFIGVLAARDGMMQATAIFQSLLHQLFDDPEFIAVSRQIAMSRP
ncbi:hypothetical protein WT41_10375 [Burkholderia territorii]|uniref:hypothetical protein n=1 Tax=Burkholderia territorii TaxID=1503055 RepID=UPI0007554A7C|nr:hypothetical protein [Burkholderia territorii]KWA16322.1 hypothetical protein WT38_25420 [Burkholderia territorii]KWA46215.1 hypothetical protein WT41_10375 [Burkholderia territorii]